jgi:tetratricopeptide (TPR) repeat protein
MTSLVNKEPDELKLERTLKADPRQPSVWCALGEVRLRRNETSEARAAFENALRMDAGLAQAHFGLAAVCKAEGRPADAITHFRNGLKYSRGNAQALLDLGVVLAEQSQVDEAIECWQKLLTFQPDHAQAHHNLGVAMAQKEKPEEAIRLLEQAFELRPDYAEAHFNLANVLCNQKTRENDRRNEGVDHYLEAIRIRPTYIEPMFNLGTVLTELNRGQESAIWLEQTARLGEASTPVHHLTASAYKQLGLALCMQARYDEAQTAYKRALSISPELAEAHCNLGNLFQELGRLPEALTCYELAIMHENQPAVSKWNRALSLLQSGDYAQGWKEYEWRWQRKQTPHRPFKEPRWDGSPLEGSTLLIHMEQGLGDMIQFIRFAAQAKQRGGRILVECPGFLVPLLSRCPGVDEIFPEGILQPGQDEPNAPPFDVQIPIMSLPHVFNTTLQTIPNQVPYLFVEQELVDRWKEKLPEALNVSTSKSFASGHPTPQARTEEKPADGMEPNLSDSSAATANTQRPIPNSTTPAHSSDQTPVEPSNSLYTFTYSPYKFDAPSASTTRFPSPFKVGICWQGNPNHRLDRYRSIALSEFAPLAKIPGVRLVSLQKGPGAAQIQNLQPGIRIWEPPQSDQMTAQALLDTAALMKNLDLVISVDTGTCHLAGALGVPVWVPLSAIGEWRWLLHREDSPWYPTMRLFRQKKLGRWRGVFRRIARELEERVRKIWLEARRGNLSEGPSSTTTTSA